MVSVQRICYANDAQLWLILFQGTPVLTVLQDVSVSKLKHLKLALVLSGGYPQQVPHRRQRHAFPSGIWVATSSAHRRCNPRCFVLLRHCGLHEVALLSIIFQGEPLSTSPPHTFSVPYYRHGEVQALVVCVQRCQVLWVQQHREYRVWQKNKKTKKSKTRANKKKTRKPKPRKKQEKNKNKSKKKSNHAFSAVFVFFVFFLFLLVILPVDLFFWWFCFLLFFC